MIQSPKNESFMCYEKFCIAIRDRNLCKNICVSFSLLLKKLNMLFEQSSPFAFYSTFKPLRQLNWKKVAKSQSFVFVL